MKIEVTFEGDESNFDLNFFSELNDETLEKILYEG